LDDPEQYSRLKFSVFVCLKVTAKLAPKYLYIKSGFYHEVVKNKFNEWTLYLSFSITGCPLDIPYCSPFLESTFDSPKG
jgi:hypothetical protein